jgi:anti-anti-sigma regulatory factor
VALLPFPRRLGHTMIPGSSRTGLPTRGLAFLKSWTTPFGCMRPAFQVEIDSRANLLRIHYRDRMTAADMRSCLTAVQAKMSDLTRGFTVLADLTALEAMELDCVGDLAKLMDTCREHGVDTVVRIIPDPNKDIGFNILSIIHYRSGVHIVTCRTIAEAEQKLAT